MKFRKDNKGLTTVEVVLLLLVIISLVLIFKDQITQIIEKAFASINTGADSILK